MVNKTKEETKGSRLRSTIKSRGLSQKQFAKAIGVTDQMVSNYVTDANQMSQATLNKAAEVLNTSIDFLLMKSDIDQPERHVAMAEAAPYADAVKLYNKLRYQTAHVLKMIKAQGVRICETITVGSCEYTCDSTGMWVDISGDEVDFDWILEEVRSNFKKAEYKVEVSFLGKSIEMTEREYMAWLLSMWNANRYLLQSKFSVLDPVIIEVAETPLSRALQGLPDLEDTEQMK